MGEYAKYNGHEIKIGTCESMYYLRYEDRFQVTKLVHSLDARTEKNLFWRLPYPDEDTLEPGSYMEHNRGERLYKTVKDSDAVHFNTHLEDFSDPSTVDDPGTIQLTHPCGMLVNVKCYHGEKLPEKTDEITPFWNGRSWFYELAFIKNTAEGPIMPVVHCRHCNNMWRYTWDEILPYIQDKVLRERLEKYNIK